MADYQKKNTGVSKSQIEMLKELELKDIKINRPPNNCGWTIVAKK